LKGLAAKVASPEIRGLPGKIAVPARRFRNDGARRYLPISYSSRREGIMKVRFSSGLLLDLLVGRIIERQFRVQLDGSDGHNIIEHWLEQG
jgi:hypothetical protein